MKKEPDLLTDPIPQLIRQFAIPAIIAYIISSLYNIVDQIFIGQGMGYLGNAATNVAFPAVTIANAIALTIGLGCASNFNLAMGQGDKERAGHFVTTGITMLIICGVLFTIIVQLFMQPLLYVFGATPQTNDYATTYLGITSLGFTFQMLALAGSNIIRGDGSPKQSMTIQITGAVINTVLDPIFIFTFHLGIAGAAWATVIAQSVAGIMTLAYLHGFHTVHLPLHDFLHPSWTLFKRIFSLGFSSMIFQASVILVQLVSNNLLRSYGAHSVYGSDIPLAVAGIVAKVFTIFSAFLLGASSGGQPIYGVNYGAGNDARVRQTLKTTMTISIIMGVVATVIFEVFPRPIISLFGGGDELLMNYAVKYMRVYFSTSIFCGLFVCINTFFPSVGEAKAAATESLFKQVVLMVPLLVICTKIGGVDGIMFATPITDIVTFGMCAFMLRRFLMQCHFQQSPSSASSSRNTSV